MSTSWNVGSLMESLGERYKRSSRDKAWAEEKDAIESTLKALATGSRLRRYRAPSVAGVGGLGIVLKVADGLLKEQSCAIKFPRPKPGSQDLFAEMIAKEIVRLSEIRHNGIIRIHAADTIPVEGWEVGVPFYVMDYIDGQSSGDYLLANGAEQLVDIAVETAQAIHALHEHDLVHCDIKPDNIMVGHDGHPVVTDLGTTKVYAPNDESETRIGVTLAYASRELLDHVKANSDSDPDNYAGLIRRSQVHKEWDLVCFAKTLLAWLGYEHETGQPSDLTFTVDPYVRKYLLLMAARMLGEREGYSWLNDHIGVPGGALREFDYSTIAEVARDLEGLSGRLSLSVAVPELDHASPDIVQLSMGQSTAFTPRVRALLEHPSVRRLGAITQLGIVNQVYITATHTRLEHSLGTYSNACRLVRSLYDDPFSPFFRQVMRTQDLECILALALLHDTGQYPLAHDLEEIDPRMFDHKKLTRAILTGERNTKQKGSKPIKLPDLKDALEGWNVSPERLVELLDVRLDRFTASVRDRILHSIIDGAIDADKLDYLERDSTRLGVPYGNAVDKNRIIGSATTILTPARGNNLAACVGVHEKARVAAEFLTICRSAMFSQAYWHHAVRSMKAMLARAVLRVLAHIEGKPVLEQRFMSEFEAFALSLPYALTDEQAQLALPGDPDRKQDESKKKTTVHLDAPVSSGTLAETDNAMLMFLERYVATAGLADRELLRDIRQRRLYKRLFVWSLSEDTETGTQLAESWEKLHVREKLRVYERIEAQLFEKVCNAHEKGPETITLNDVAVNKLQLRRDTKAPILLLDVPGTRQTGSDIPLYYVVEGQRRALRKDGSAVGEAHESATWQQFGRDLRKRAGKLRLFCHEEMVDAVEAAVDRTTMEGMLETAFTEVNAV